MKFALGIALFSWLLCGLVGAWILGELNLSHWKTVAYGGITLAKALDEHPATIPDSG